FGSAPPQPAHYETTYGKKPAHHNSPTHHQRSPRMTDRLVAHLTITVKGLCGLKPAWRLRRYSRRRASRAVPLLRPEGLTPASRPALQLAVNADERKLW